MRQELKAQLKKVKKELYVANMKMNLAEKIGKLKDKEVQNMKAKIYKTVKQCDKKLKESEKALQKSENDFERNFNKAARELTQNPVTYLGRKM